jgi:sterigmatocystin biosynthesis cytochrome P450 monooxygenase
MPPHHAVFGHLQIVGGIMSKLPSDVHGHLLPHQIRLMFPELGPIFYIDTWPFGPPILAVASLDGVRQITQVHSLPKFHALRDFLRPVTGGSDLVTMEGNEWKQWRNIFNPGFSSSHLRSLIPEMLKDVSIFCEILRDLAEKRDIFLMDPLTTRLSLDVISRVTL